MSVSPPSWYIELRRRQTAQISQICALYPARDRDKVLAALLVTAHHAASDIDPENGWLLIALSGVENIGPSTPNVPQGTALDPNHASHGDAASFVEDILHASNDQYNAVTAIRCAVHVLWEQFAYCIAETDRKTIATYAARLA